MVWYQYQLLMEQSTPDALLRFVGDKTENEIGSANSKSHVLGKLFSLRYARFRIPLFGAVRKRKTKLTV